MSWHRSVVLSGLDVRVLRATHPLDVLTVAQLAQRAGCAEDVARSSLGRLRRRMLVESYRCRPTGWVRTRDGDVVLEHQP
jgi:hypothetical protein